MMSASGKTPSVARKRWDVGVVSAAIENTATESRCFGRQLETANGMFCMLQPSVHHAAWCIGGNASNPLQFRLDGSSP